MPEVSDNELIVIGGGPGGYVAAFLAAEKGMRVTLVEERAAPGGTCLHVGCTPSKALLHASKLIYDAVDAAKFGITFGKPKIDIAAVRKHWQDVVAKMSNNLTKLCKQREIKVLHGRAKFVGADTIQLTDGSQHRFKNAILATGSSPAKPGSLNLDHPAVMTSTEALQLEGVPGSLLVVGGGYIGLELGFVYAGLGSDVTVVEMTPTLLPGADRDLVLPLAKRLEKIFKSIHMKTQVLKLEPSGKGIKAHLQGEGIADATPVFDRVLISVGRRPNSRDLGLDAAGIQVTDKGFVVVDPQRRTTNANVFAIGDVAGEPMLAHKASYEGKVAVEAIAGEKTVVDYRAMPAVVFTDPELAWCGLTQTEVDAAKRDDVEITRFPWAASGRAETVGRTEGLTKILTDKATDRVLGVGIVGKDAGEMISEAMLAIEMGATARDLALTIHPHPTLSETLMESAELSHGFSAHLFRAKKKEKSAT